MPSIVVTSEPSACTASTGAALHRVAIEVDRARAAVGGVTAHVRAGEAEPVADEVDEQEAGSTSSVYCTPFTVNETRAIQRSSSIGRPFLGA